MSIHLNWEYIFEFAKPISFQCCLLVHLKTSENQMFSDTFRGVKREHWKEISFIELQRSTKLAVDALKRQNWCCSDVCILDFNRFRQLVERLKAALPGLGWPLATERPLKLIKKAFYFSFKVLFVLEIFKCLSLLFGRVEKRLDYKVKINFKMCDVTTWETNNFNTHIAHYLKK